METPLGESQNSRTSRRSLVIPHHSQPLQQAAENSHVKHVPLVCMYVHRDRRVANGGSAAVLCCVCVALVVCSAFGCDEKESYGVHCSGWEGR